MGQVQLRGDRPLEPGLLDSPFATTTVEGDIWPNLTRLRGGGQINGTAAYPIVTVWPVERMGYVDQDGTPVLENKAPIFEGPAAVHIRDRIRTRRADDGYSRVRIREYQIEFPFGTKLPNEVLVNIKDEYYDVKAFRMFVLDSNGLKASLIAERSL